MGWYCTGCGTRRYQNDDCPKCGESGAERIPPLDGFMILETDDVRTDEEDLAAREAYFAAKRARKVVTA